MNRRGWFGAISLGVLFFFAMTAELWSNSKPLYLHRDGRAYFPVFKNYSASEMGIQDAFVIDYRELVQKDRDQGKNTRAIFPVNAWDPLEQTPDVMTTPNARHWLGTDSLGRDVSARLLYGVRVSIAYGISFWFFCFLIGVAVGIFQGFLGGRTDFLTERFKELLDILPFFSVVILVNGLMKSDSFLVTLGVVVVFSWTAIASQMRAAVLSVRKREFVEAARAAGAKNGRIIFRHILPNVMTPILTLTPFTVSSGISILAILDYLGYGLSPPTPSLGELLEQGRVYIQNAPWLLIAPTIALIWLLISINVLGESIREAFDPKKA